MRLYLLRHGDAVESPYYQDSERPLSDLGRRQTQTVGRFLQAERIKPDLILTSPLLRAKETGEIIKEALKVKGFMTAPALASGASTRDCIKEINNHNLSSLVLVGHEPQMSGLISVLTGGDEQFRVEMAKDSLACLETRHPVKKGHAVLLWLLPVEFCAIVR
jgi:phosphohistidine phosphatase